MGKGRSARIPIRRANRRSGRWLTARPSAGGRSDQTASERRGKKPAEDGTLRVKLREALGEDPDQASLLVVSAHVGK